VAAGRNIILDMIKYLKSVSREFNCLQLACDKCNTTILEMRAKPLLSPHEKRLLKDAKEHSKGYMHAIEQRQAMVRFLDTSELSPVENFIMTWS
jgi:hypothetical protein